MKCSIVIPTLNEAENVQRNVDIFTAIRSYRLYNAKIIVVDDTKDDSVERACKESKWADYTHNQKHLGYGKSLKVGFNRAIKDNADIIIMMDADHSIDYLGYILNYLESYDMVIGAEKATNKERGITRWLCKNFLGLDFRHPTCGYIGFKTHILEKINTDRIMSNWDMFHVELLKMCNDSGFSIGEFEFEAHHGERNYSLKRYVRWLWDFLKCYLFS